MLKSPWKSNGHALGLKLATHVTILTILRCICSYSAIPDKPRCFCGRTINPEPRSGVTPHCCTHICNKIRRENCPHRCTLPCHPGPCPPCGAFSPNVVCWSHHTPIGVRCGDTSMSSCPNDTSFMSRFTFIIFLDFSCHKPCGKLLNCGIHTCQQECHPGPCKECTHKADITCYCGKRTRRVKCADRNGFSHF